MRKALLFLLLLLLLTPQVVFAQEMPSGTQSATVDYTLPYPGILPDSPLYFFKTLRDKIVSFLVTDPQKQAEFDLLQADKRLVAGRYLFTENHPKYDLGYETISKAENYFFYSIENASIAKKQGEDVNGLLDTMLRASLKHKEVLQQLEQTAPDSFKPKIVNEVKRVGDLTKQVTSLKQKH